MNGGVSTGVKTLPAAASCCLAGPSCPSPGGITSNESTDNCRKASDGLWAQLSLNSYLEMKHPFKAKSLNCCSSAYHTNSLLGHREQYSSSQQTLLNHQHGRLALGFPISLPGDGSPGTPYKRYVQVSTSHRIGKGKTQTVGQFSSEVCKLYYFYEGFKGLETKFHIRMKLKEKKLSFFLSAQTTGREAK